MKSGVILGMAVLLLIAFAVAMGSGVRTPDWLLLFQRLRFMFCIVYRELRIQLPPVRVELTAAAAEVSRAVTLLICPWICPKPPQPFD